MSRPLTSAFALSALLALALAPAAQAMPMAGSFTGHVDSQTPQMLGPNHMKVRQTATGTNSSPGTPLDGAKVQWDETVTLKDGQGPVVGTITFITPGGTTVSSYKGTVSTDAQGRVTGKGSYRDTGATGAFAGLKGKGNFSVAYSSKTDFTGAWKGNATLPSPKTSQR